MNNFAVRVSLIVDEAEGIRSFRLEADNGKQLSEFRAGSHIDVKVGPDITRPYSLCGPQNDPDHYLIAVKREPESRGGSVAMFDKVVVGSTLEISHPRNNFELDEKAGHTVLLAGGIGITPIISMADRLGDLGRSFELHYFTRSPKATAFHDRLSKVNYTSNIHSHYSLDPEDTKTYLQKLLWKRPEEGQIYLCGPKPFMSLVDDVAASTWPPDSVKREYFTANSEFLGSARDSFEVTLARSGGTYYVRSDETILDVLYDNGVNVNYSCEQGVCGTCLTGVVEGIPDHRDNFLTEKQKEVNDRMCICVSRAKSGKLVLDI